MSRIAIPQNIPRVAAAVAFARKLVETRGKVAAGDLDTVRAAGYSDANIVEIIAQFLLTNFVNNVFDTEIDFPVIDAEVA
jgi:alkylhydroperoxidase family enzyme